MRFAVAVVAAGIIAWAISAPVEAAPGGGTVAGLVRNATTGAPVADSPVQIVFISGQAAEPVGEARSDAGGRFAFAGLIDGRYLISARHQGVSYAAHAVVAGSAPVDVTVTVYDVSPQVALRAALLGVAVEVRGGYVRVSEVVHLQNPSTRTFLGDLTFALPAGARFVVFSDGFHQPRGDGGAITDRLIVRPGTHQVAYQYSLRGDGEVSLARRLTLPVDRLELFVDAPAEARSARVQALPMVTNEGRTYTRAGGRAVPAGDLELTIVGVPGARLWVAPVAAGMLAAVLIVGLMLAMTRKANGPSPEAEGDAGDAQNQPER
jgi:hypothetical protein